MNQITAKWHTSIREIKKEQYQNLFAAIQIPFYQWQWLYDLEESKIISRDNGWQPMHLSLWRNKEIIAIAPLYLKGHSFGEFIFDQIFVELAHNLKLSYYPKLIGMSPYSPITGYRFLISTLESEEEITNLIMNLIDNFSIRNKILSCNFLYVDKDWVKIAEQAKCLKWLNKRNIWESDSQNNFDEYLNRFNSNQKRNIKRERASIKKSGISIATLKGNEINKESMQKMYYFYSLHCSKWGVWGSKYLSESFFEKLSELEHSEQLVLFYAYRENPKDPLAMSLCVTDNKMLWGRYWGAKEEIDCLHFELCYYSPISWALMNGIKCFDPGSGGIKHKLRRGFLIQPTISLHRWYDQQMNNLIQTWLPTSNKLMEEEINSLNQQIPLKAKDLKV